MFTLHYYRAAAAADATTTELTAVTDPIAFIQNGRVTPNFNSDVLFAAVVTHTPVLARLNSPSWRQLSAPNLYPFINDNARTNGMWATDFIDNPMQARALEEITFEAQQASGGAAVIGGMIALAPTPLLPVPGGRPFIIRATSTTAAVAGAWTTIAITYPDSLPNGIYAVVGLTHQSANGRACRLIFAGQFERPGTPSVESVSESSVQVKFGQRLGVFGRFDNYRMPVGEVLCEAADAAHVLLMTVIRVG